MIKFKYSNPLEEDYGYSVKNPIEVRDISDEYFYLSNLITDKKVHFRYKRECSCAGNTPYPIDKFNIFIGEKKICDLYFYGYSDKKSIIAPRGFFYIEQINWGEGIPEYDETDLMTSLEIQDFAIEIIINGESKEYEILGFNNRLNVYPSIFMRKDEKLYAVLVRGGSVKTQPKITQHEIEIMNEIAFKLNAIPLYASVGFGAADEARFDKDILLRGDGFYANYTGFEEIPIIESIGKNIAEETILNYVWENFINIISNNENYIDLYIVLKDAKLSKENDTIYAIEFENNLSEYDRFVLQMPQYKAIITTLFSKIFNKSIQVYLKYPQEWEFKVVRRKIWMF